LIKSQGQVYTELMEAAIEEGELGCWSNPDAWYPDSYENPRGWQHEKEIAVKLCNDCPVMGLCAAYAILSDEKYGIWGGTTPRDRALMRSGRMRYPASFSQIIAMPR
jgi:WhiB family redox-sensing transcriptional regulator